jgi:hypothetical protein
LRSSLAWAAIGRQIATIAATQWFHFMAVLPFFKSPQT